MIQVLHRAPRPKVASGLVLALMVGFGFCLVLTSYLGARGTLFALVVLGAATLYASAVGRSRVVWYEPQSGHVIVEWRPPLFRVRRRVFAASRFVSVVSYYPWGKGSRNWVCLVERTGGAGLNVASFDLNYQYRSFWDLFPEITESPGARELRTQLVETLSLTDEGFVGLHSHPKSSK